MQTCIMDVVRQAGQHRLVNTAVRAALQASTRMGSLKGRWRCLCQR